jgi:hypothetical protein
VSKGSPRLDDFSSPFPHDSMLTCDRELRGTRDLSLIRARLLLRVYYPIELVFSV